MDRTGTRPLKVGMFVSAMQGGMRDGALRWTDIRAMAERSEEVGFDSFWLPDHLVFKNEGQPVHGPWECWSLLSALAAVTSRVELGTLVVCTAFRNPTLLAKMADTLDEISGGRLILGLGAGWHEPEYSMFGYPYDHRVSRFEEAVTIIRTLLREGRVDFHGTYYEATDCELRPRGPRPAGPPILIGAIGSGPRMMRLTATHADLWNGWLVPHGSQPSDVPPLRTAVDEACRTVGREPATLTRTVGVLVVPPGLSDRPVGGIGDGKALSGSPAEIAAALRAFAAEGIAHVQLMPTTSGIAAVEALAPVLEELDRT